MDRSRKSGGCSWIAPEKPVAVHGSPPKNAGGSWNALGAVVVHGSPSKNLWRFMERPRKMVAVHGTPPKNLWRFMERPRKTCGGSWIAPEKPVAVHGTPLENQWRFMERPRKPVAVHGSPSNGGAASTAPKKWYNLIILRLGIGMATEQKYPIWDDTILYKPEGMRSLLDCCTYNPLPACW